MHDDGGPAFPCETPDRTAMFTSGMTLRDWFAGQALVGFLSNAHEFGHECGQNPNKAAAWAYEQADAMLAARKAAP